jgi:hypothetical protein
MSDLMLIGITLVFFAASYGFVAACDRWMEG